MMTKEEVMKHPMFAEVYPTYEAWSNQSDKTVLNTNATVENKKDVFPNSILKDKYYHAVVGKEVKEDGLKGERGRYFWLMTSRQVGRAEGETAQRVFTNEHSVHTFIDSNWDFWIAFREHFLLIYLL